MDDKIKDTEKGNENETTQEVSKKDLDGVAGGEILYLDDPFDLAPFVPLSVIDALYKPADIHKITPEERKLEEKEKREREKNKENADIVTRD